MKKPARRTTHSELALILDLLADNLKGSPAFRADGPTIAAVRRAAAVLLEQDAALEDMIGVLRQARNDLPKDKRAEVNRVLGKRFDA